jgi:hypothetical protein
MKPFKKIILAVLLIPIVLVVGSLFLPAQYRVERAIVINANPAAVFAQVNTLKHWPEWTAWKVAKYPDMQVSFSGPEAGVGATYTWDGKSTGHGTLKITQSEPDRAIAYDLAFDHGKYVSTGGINIAPSGDAVTVTWFNEGDLGWNPVSRVFGLFMDKMMGPDFEEGLRNIQKTAEAK